MRIVNTIRWICDHSVSWMLFSCFLLRRVFGGKVYRKKITILSQMTLIDIIGLLTKKHVNFMRLFDLSRPKTDLIWKFLNETVEGAPKISFVKVSRGPETPIKILSNQPWIESSQKYLENTESRATILIGYLPILLLYLL